MKSLDTLIRLQKWQLDEKRRQLGELRKMQADLDASIGRLDQEIAAEVALATHDPSLGATFGVFAQAARERRERLLVSQRELDAQITAVEREIGDAFAELKKVELTQQNRASRKRLSDDRRAQASLDEVGGMLTRRRQLAAAGR